MVVVVVLGHRTPAGLQGVVVVVELGTGCKGLGDPSAMLVAMKNEAAGYARTRVERNLP